MRIYFQANDAVKKGDGCVAIKIIAIRKNDTGQGEKDQGWQARESKIEHREQSEQSRNQTNHASELMRTGIESSTKCLGVNMIRHR
jgi:hypothetical protein